MKRKKKVEFNPPRVTEWKITKISPPPRYEGQHSWVQGRLTIELSDWKYTRKRRTYVNGKGVTRIDYFFERELSPIEEFATGRYKKDESRKGTEG